MKWNTNFIDLGLVIQRVPQKIEFIAISEIPKIKEIISSCGCSQFHYNNIKKRLIGTYTPSDVPYHLDKSYETTKTVTILYDNGEKEIFKFKATVLKK